MNESHDFGDVIREAFRQTGRSIKSVADETGTAYSRAHGLLTGTSDTKLSTASAIAWAVGLELRPRRKTKREGGKAV